MAATNKLTDHKIKSIKPSGKVEKHSDGGGLYLHVSPAGGKLWRLAYRLDGKQQTATLKSGDGTKQGDALAKVQNGWTRATLAWGKLFGYAEQINRRSTFIAAYRLAVENGHKNPAAFAEKAVNETQFVNNKANKMKFGRGAIGATLMTFKSYSINWFQPQSVARVQEGNAFMQRSKDFYTLKAQEIRSLWARGIFEGDQDMVQKARDQITQWNEDNPDQRMTANMPAIIKRVREMRKDKAQRIADTAPKGMRAAMREEARALSE